MGERKAGFWLSLVAWGVLVIGSPLGAGWKVIPRDLLGPLTGGAAVVASVALVLSVAAWRRGMKRGYAIAGTVIGGAGLVAALFWLAVLLVP